MMRVNFTNISSQINKGVMMALGRSPETHPQSYSLNSKKNQKIITADNPEIVCVRFHQI